MSAKFDIKAASSSEVSDERNLAKLKFKKAQGLQFLYGTLAPWAS